MELEDQIKTIKVQISNFDTVVEKVMYIHQFFRPDPMFKEGAEHVMHEITSAPKENQNG